MSDRQAPTAPTDRHLDWEGCFNIRDLGGLPLTGGGTTRRGAVIRADNPGRLTPAGWSALVAHGVRTIVDLRNHDELTGDLHPRPSALTTVHVPLDDAADTAFWTHVQDNGLHGSPLYYRPFIDRKARQCAAALTAIAEAHPAGVLFHCGLGRDRTGLITLLLLTLTGVTPHQIATDYALSTTRLPPLFTALAIPDQTAEIQATLTQKNTTAHTALLNTLTDLNIEAHLQASGLTPQHIQALRDRLLPTP
ncbi:tyrosine-protein phosphatase [Sphaerisporangium aureirubrum]|uniref:Tyrosine-protein phosphatase n=1 Tax=Sphaerisporangium aureirubrum TaxID=1544736 RepID=A0ABW1NLY8_9ACTN